MDAVEEIKIVIVGGGLCGLATALALHRKGIKSVVLERSESLRATGAGIAVHTNGWRALDQLGIGSKLRQTALPIQAARTIWLDSGKQQELPVSEGEARCVVRRELIELLAAHLPLGTVRFGSQIISVKLDTQTSSPILQMHDGRIIKAKIVIGCDGANSVIADFLELKPTKLITAYAVRGFTNYPNGHGFAPEYTRQKKGQVLLGRAPVSDTLVFWFVVLQACPKDSNVSKDPELIRQLALESAKGFPTEMIEMINGSDLNSLSLTHMRYRAPWDILFGRFRKGSVTVAGDAMHVMGPFLGQGGSAGVEDAIVLARCLAPTLLEVNLEKGGRGMMVQKVGDALDAYVKERRMRLVRLSTQTYLMVSEGKGMLEVVVFCHNLGMQEVILKGDALTIVQAMNSKEANWSEDARMMLSTFQSWRVDRVKREANEAAHRLAKETLFLDSDVIDIESCPFCIQAYILENALLMIN